MTSATDGSINAAPTDVDDARSATASSPELAPQATGVRSPALDSLRALAAFAVLLTHAGDATTNDFGKMPLVEGLPARIDELFGIRFPTGVAIQQLNVGVEIFFVLSALLVYKPFLQSHVLGNQHPEPIRFVWKRAWRIFPAYWIALFTIVAVFTSRALNTADQILTNGLLTWGYGAPRWFGGGIGLKQSWTLVVEVSFYAFVPLWAWVMRAIGKRFSALRVETIGALVLTVAGPVFMFLTRGHTPWTPFRVLPPYFGAFGIGMLLACALVAKEQRSSQASRLDTFGRYTIACWLAAAAVFAITIHNVDLSGLAMLVKGSSNQSIERTMHTIVAGLIVTPVVFGLRRGSIIGRLLHWKPLAMVGLWSYGFYLWHYAFIDYMHQQRFDINSNWFMIKIVAVATVGAIAAGAASWYLIERPCLRLSAGQVRRPQWLRWRRPSFYTGLSLITFGALMWRVSYVITNIGRLKLSGDAFYYHTQANDIAAGRWFIDPSQFAWYGRVTPSAGHPPTYLMYLAGVSRWIGQSELTHRLASTLIGAATVFALGMLARKLFDDDRAGWVAAAFGAVYAHLWINDEMLMSETMAQLWTVIAFIAVYRFWRNPNFGTAAGMGAAIGLAAMSRAEAATLFPLLVIPLVLLVRTLTFRRRISVIVLSCTVGGLMMAPWLLYNVGRFEHPVLMSNGVGSVLMVANCDRTYGKHTPTDGQDRNAYLGYWSVGCAIDGGFTALQKGDESEKEVEWRKVGIDYISANMSDYPKMAVLRVARMWDIGFIGQNVFPFNAALEGRGAWPSTLATMQYLVLMPLGIHGLVLLRRRRVPIIPFLAIAGTITFTAATTFGITRYRAPVDALLCALAAGAVVARLDRSKRVAGGREVAMDHLVSPTESRDPWTLRSLIRTPTAMFCTIALTIGTLFAVLTPALTGYDEPVHFLRAWQISDGGIISNRANLNGTVETGAYFPTELLDDAVNLFGATFVDDAGNRVLDGSRPFARIRDRAPGGAPKFEGFSQSAVYAPVPYFPAAAALRIGRAIGLSTLALVWAGRLATLFAYVALIARALHHAPRRRWLLAVLALVPVCAFQSAMLSADGITTALVLLTAALAQSLFHLEPDKLRLAHIVEFAILVLALGLAKPPCILFSALILPALWKHRRTKSTRWLLIAPIPGIAAFVAWSRYAQSIYLPPKFGFGTGSYAYRGVDADEQLSQLLDHPWSLISIIARTVEKYWQSLLHDVVAQVPGWEPNATTKTLIAVCAYLAIFAAVLRPEPSDYASTTDTSTRATSVNKLQAVTALLVCTGTTIAIFVLAYTGWNQVGAPRIDAFQGRYLYPPFAIAMLYLPVMKLRGVATVPQRWPVAAVAVVSFVTLVGSTLHYY